MPAQEPDHRHPRMYWDYILGIESERETGPTSLGIAWSGIVLAAGCYPVLLGLIFAIVHSLATYSYGTLAVGVIGALFRFLIISFVCGLVYGMFMSVPAVFLTRLLRWSLKGLVSDRGISGIYGGMTGFFCLSGGGLFFVSGIPTIRNWEQLFFLWFAPLLAVVMGYTGAILAGYRRRNDGFAFYEPIFSFEKQITISYLMKLTFIVAVLAVIFKAAGTAGLNIGIAWLAYFTAQTLLLVCDHWITRWLSRR